MSVVRLARSESDGEREFVSFADDDDLDDIADGMSRDDAPQIGGRTNRTAIERCQHIADLDAGLLGGSAATGDANAQLLNVAVKRFHFLTLIDKTCPREPRQVRQTEIVKHAVTEYEPLRLSILCQQTDARSDSIPRPANVNHLTIDQYPSRVTAISTKQQPRRFRSTRTNQSRERHDLARPN